LSIADEREKEREGGGVAGDQKRNFGGLQKRGCCGNPVWKITPTPPPLILATLYSLSN